MIVKNGQEKNVVSNSGHSPTGFRAGRAKQSKSSYASWYRLGAELVLVVALVVVSAYAIALRSDNTDLKKQAKVVSQNPQAMVEQQTKMQVDKVGQLMQLPTDEQPTVANVSDASQARKQSAFFKDAQNGDTVLMYVKSGQAILYRPSTDRIVLVAPLTFDQPAANSTTTKR